MFSRILGAAFLGACWSGPREASPHRADTGETAGVDSDTEPGETELWIDTAGACVESSVPTSLDDRSLGFTAADIVATVAATPFSSLTWRSAPDGAPTAESLALVCDEVPTSALIVTRVDHLGLGEAACPPGPELWTFQGCAVNVGDGGIATDTRRTGAGGAALSDLMIALEAVNPTLDSAHAEALSRQVTSGFGATVTESRLDVVGPLHRPPIWLTADFQSAEILGTGIFWDGVINPPTP